MLESNVRTRRPGGAANTPGLADWIGVDVSDVTCSVEGCAKRRHARGWCGTHYARWAKSGDVRSDLPVNEQASSADESFDRRTRKGDGCWLWTGAKSAGYGKVTLDGRMAYAHRYSYERYVGPIPEGHQIDHLCRNRACVNPDHLEPVTPLENVRRGEVGGFVYGSPEDQCVNGHRMTQANTYRKSPDASRGCRKCIREAQRRYDTKRKAS